MTAWAIDERGDGYAVSGRYKTEDGAIRRLLGLLPAPIGIRCLGASREPLEVTAEWLMEHCGKVTRY